MCVMIHIPEVSMKGDKDRFPLRELRLTCNLSQVEVAKAAGISRRFYVDVESKRQEPRVVAALLIARVLGATVEEAFGDLIERAAPAGKP